MAITTESLVNDLVEVLKAIPNLSSSLPTETELKSKLTYIFTNLLTAPIEPVALNNSLSTLTLDKQQHTLVTSSANKSFNISYSGNLIVLEVILNAVTSTFTFLPGETTLCINEGDETNNNICILSGESGDRYLIAIQRVGSNYSVACKNFGKTS